MRAAAWWGAGLVALAAGLVAGSWSAPRSSIPPLLAVVSPEDCAAQVASRTSDLEALRREAYGDPRPFPADLDPDFSPAAVEARARRVEVDCPALGWSLLAIECDEYPCFTVWDLPDDIEYAEAVGRQWEAIECGAGVTKPGIGHNVASTNGSVRAEDGTTVQVFVIASYPPRALAEGFGKPADDRRKTRLAMRKDLALEELR